MGIEIDLTRRTQDPEKFDFFRDLFLRNRDAIRLWGEMGLQERIKVEPEAVVKGIKAGQTIHYGHGEFNRRKHNANEHMAVVATVATTLAEMIGLPGELVTQIERAAMFHDACKYVEVRIVKCAKGDPSKLQQLVQEYFPENTPDVTNRPCVTSEDIGTRALDSYFLSEEISKGILETHGVDPKTIELAQSVAFTSCPEIDQLIDGFDEISNLSERKFALARLVMHLADDSVQPGKETGAYMPPESNALSERYRMLELNPAYTEFNQAYSSTNTGRETAFEMQARVGLRTRDFLANHLDINPEELHARIYQEMQQRIGTYGQQKADNPK